MNKIIVDRLSNRKLSVFCGAGVSYNSGVPIVSQLTGAIFQKLELSREEQALFNQSTYPFEAFMELLQCSSDIERLVKIYELGDPNTNHIFLANLAKANKLRNIITTNFDSLIEKAFCQLGLIEKVDYDVYCNETEFNLVNWNDDKINIIKIHGSASDIDSVAITLELVASQSQSPSRSNIVRQFFNKGHNPLILILGYSCSDVFDISPIINSLDNSLSEVVLVEHTKSSIARIEDIRFQSINNPFKKFNSGIRLFLNTDYLIKILWTNYQFPNYEFIIEKGNLWLQLVNEWHQNAITTTSTAFSHHISGQMFFNISEFRYAIVHHSKSISIATHQNDYTTLSSELGNLGMAYNALNNYDEAIKCLETSIDICKRVNNYQGEISQLQTLGNIYRNLARYEEAEDKFIEAAFLIRIHGKLFDLCTTLGNLSLVYNLTAQYDKTILAGEEALSISQKLGIKQSEGSIYSSLGIAYHSIGDSVKGTQYLMTAVGINKLIGDKNNECMSLTNLGKIHLSHGNFDEAIKCLKEALPIAISLNTVQTEALIYFTLAENYFLMSNIDLAKSMMTKAIAIFKNIYPSDHPFFKAAVNMLRNYGSSFTI